MPTTTRLSGLKRIAVLLGTGALLIVGAIWLLNWVLVFLGAFRVL